MTTTTLDPARADLVGNALLAYLRARLGIEALDFADAPAPLGRGFASFIYAFRLAGDALPDQWRMPLVLRVLPDAATAQVLRREEAIQHFVGAHGYRVLAPLTVETSDATFGLPFAITLRLMRGTMLERVTHNPLSVPRLLAAMGEAHVALHRIPIQDALSRSRSSLCDAACET
jgi:aminoglycoside phosphotransferase (APT) family kinase protein